MGGFSLGLWLDVTRSFDRAQSRQRDVRFSRGGFGRHFRPLQESRLEFLGDVFEDVLVLAPSGGRGLRWFLCHGLLGGGLLHHQRNSMIRYGLELGAGAEGVGVGAGVAVALGVGFGVGVSRSLGRIDGSTEGDGVGEGLGVGVAAGATHSVPGK